MIAADVPVDPGAGQARQWLLDELAKPAYAAARPTPFDLFAQAVGTWFQSLFAARNGVGVHLLVVAGLVVVVALVVVALLLFGLPRLNRRSRLATSLFGEDDTRSAAELRRAATAALAAGDLDTALLERYRALARGLDERTVVAVLPGTTATGFAVDAARAFPGESGELAAAARSFDGVRYGGSPATRDQAERVAALDDRVAAARPALEAVPS